MNTNKQLLEGLKREWNDLIECEGEAKIVGHQKKIATAILLENQRQMLRESGAFGGMTGVGGVHYGNGTGNGPMAGADNAGMVSTMAGNDMAGYDPVMIPMVRRAIPQLIAFDIVGVQPMTLPTGLIFARRAMYAKQSVGAGGREALFDEADVSYGSNTSFRQNANWKFSGQGRFMGESGITRGVGANYIQVDPDATSGSTIVFKGNAEDLQYLKPNTPIIGVGISPSATILSADIDTEWSRPWMNTLEGSKFGTSKPDAEGNTQRTEIGIKNGLVTDINPAEMPKDGEVTITLTINGQVDADMVAKNPIVQIPLYSGRGYIASYAGEGQGDDMQHITMRIEKIAVEAETHQLRTGYSVELAQDMRRLHNMDAEAELIDIMSKELVTEQNRIVLRDLYNVAKPACQECTTPGIWDYNLDSDGRWSNEKFKGLLFNIWRDSNAIGVETRMGLGNIMVCSPNVASGLAAAGALDFAPAIQNLYNLQNADFTQNTFAGVIDGKMNVYIDPYAEGDFYMVGFKGASAMEAGYFLCPYIPAQIVRATDPVSFQPLLGMKMRYGRGYNPLSGSNQFRQNCYYRIAGIQNLGADGYAGYLTSSSDDYGISMTPPKP